jgi:hypothetical protein
MLHEFASNLVHNLFKPLLLFFYLGFLIPVAKVPFEIPKPVYKGLNLYLLLAIGWHGGEELAMIHGNELGDAIGFMVMGFGINFILGWVAYGLLERFTGLRRIDAAMVAGHYGSDSAGTFVTCLGVLVAAKIAYAAYMPVLLAVMEIPGCLVALLLVNRLRSRGMDKMGNMPDEPGYLPAEAGTHKGGLSLKVLHEIFFNPGIYLLLGGIAIGFISRLQGVEITAADDFFFINMFQGVLCLFLLEMGITASKRLRDLRRGGIGFILFGVMVPVLFACVGILCVHLFGVLRGGYFDLGTYMLFAVLCGAASYIAVPAIQRMAVPEASPTLPLAASLGLTFSFNVTIGIPLYMMIASALIGDAPTAG